MVGAHAQNNYRRGPSDRGNVGIVVIITITQCNGTTAQHFYWFMRAASARLLIEGN